MWRSLAHFPSLSSALQSSPLMVSSMEDNQPDGSDLSQRITEDKWTRTYYANFRFTYSWFLPMDGAPSTYSVTLASANPLPFDRHYYDFSPFLPSLLPLSLSLHFSLLSLRLNLASPIKIWLGVFGAPISQTHFSDSLSLSPHFSLLLSLLLCFSQHISFSFIISLHLKSFIRSPLTSSPSSLVISLQKQLTGRSVAAE